MKMLGTSKRLTNCISRRLTDYSKGIRLLCSIRSTAGCVASLKLEIVDTCTTQKKLSKNMTFTRHHAQLEKFRVSINELEELLEACESTQDEMECASLADQLNREWKEYQLESALDSHSPEANCFVEVKAGAGGADSFDWARILMEMIKSWSNHAGFQFQTMEEHKDADTGGYRSATVQVTGLRCCGYLQAIAGVHRLVRVSPFDPKKKRHTSFAQVITYPQQQQHHHSNNNSHSTDHSLSNNGIRNDLQIDDKDLRIDTFRSSGAGGQHVNTTDSAVRITHLPTGVVVGCQNERSQHQNKHTALLMLRSKLIALQQEQERALRLAASSGLGENSWGHQVRSVVLQPYQLVKDHRADWQTGNVEKYLAGNELLTESMVAVLLRQQQEQQQQQQQQ